MQYEYKNNRYVVVQENAKMKIGQVWLYCVIYHPADNNRLLYVREAMDFHEKFKAV